MPDILFEAMRSEGEYREFLISNANILADYASYEDNLYAAYKGTPFIIKGFCWRCQRKRRFFVDDRQVCRHGADLVPNLRESLACQCGLTSRGRGTYHFLQHVLRPESHPRIYISERVTYLFHALQQVYLYLEGAEYFHPAATNNDVVRSGIRGEDATSLSYPDLSFDAYLSFEVFEHIPNYLAAFREAYRVLRSQGKLIFSVPFQAGQYKHLVRARVRPDGDVEHLCAPEYHGDPTSTGGSLCFQHFGWQLADELKEFGFRGFTAHAYLSARYGYLGAVPLIFTAFK